MINLREHLKLTGIYTFFAAFPAILQLIVYPIIEGKNRLGAEDFGYLAITEAIISFISVFCLFGAGIAISRFYFDYCNNSEKCNKLNYTIFISILARGTLIIVVLYFFSDFFGKLFSINVLQNFRSYGYFLGIIALNRTIVLVSLALYRTEKLLSNFIIISLFSGLFRSSFQVIGTLYLDMSFQGYLMGTAIGGSIPTLFIIIYIFKKHGFSFSKKIFVEIFKYTYPLFFTDLLTWGTAFFDRFLLLKNPIHLGIYDNALKFVLGIQFISQGLAASIQPELFRLFKKGSKKTESEIKSLSHIFIAESILSIAFFLLPVVLFIQLFFETELLLSAEIVPIMMMKFILYAQFQVFLWPIIYEKNTKTYFYLSLIVLFTAILLNLILVPVFGYYGSIYSFLITGFIQILLFRFMQNKILPIRWNYFKVFHFPLIVIFVVSIFDFFRLYFNINLNLYVMLITIFIFVGLFILYKKELLSIIKRTRLINKT